MKEHFRLRDRNDSEDTPLQKHTKTYHPGKEPDFEIKVVDFFMDPLTRQVNEGVRINNSQSDPGLLINSKSEFRQGVVPRIRMVTGLQS